MSGQLRITAPADFDRNRLVQHRIEFSAEHPRAKFQVNLEDAVANFFSEPIDLALRYGSLANARLIALPLGAPAPACCAL